MINTKEAKPERMVTMDNKSKLLDCLYKNMIAYFAGNPKRLQHFIKSTALQNPLQKMKT